MPPEGDAGDFEPALRALSEHLDEYARELPARERQLLDVLIYRAMSPLQRARARGDSSLLTQEELALLLEIEHGHDQAR